MSIRAINPISPQAISPMLMMLFSFVMIRVSQKTPFFGCASWQANTRWPVMPETRWPKMVAPLWVLVPPSPPNVSDPYSKVENSKLSYKAHCMLIQKLLRRKIDLGYFQYSTINILKDTEEKQNGCYCCSFSHGYFKKYYKYSTLAHLKSVLLIKGFWMSIWWFL